VFPFRDLLYFGLCTPNPRRRSMSLPRPHSTRRLTPVATQPAALQFAHVYQLHAPFVSRSLSRLGVRDCELDDQVQEVFLKVLQKLPSFSGDAAVTTWLYEICRRTASDFRRLAHVRR
jgi:RNA polymerase sigma-70 factor, ECF subfamily